MNKQRKKLLRISIVLLIVLSVTLIGISIVVSRYMILKASSGKTYSDVQALPTNEVGLVLGCSRILPDGRENLFFKYRISAAFEAFNNGKIEYVIVSGDNHIKSYDEPSEMKAALVKMGIPDKNIYCDYAGFRTLDSIVRAKEVFKVSKITVISQEFHNQRAIFIGQKRGLDVIGFNAKDVNSRSAIKTRCREHLARVKAVIDVMIIKRNPKFLGDPIYIGTDT